ncbi:MAG: response regulator transcription factor [Deltaproteobacteria bacterium]|nr:response regulator transcription factor [Deltaproteobacteria bacterium]
MSNNSNGAGVQNGSSRTHVLSGAYTSEADLVLTRQERKVLRLLARALSNKEIAEALKISPSTAKRHMENILGKLGLKNRVEAAIYALRMEGCPLRVRPDDCPLQVWLPARDG